MDNFDLISTSSRLVPNRLIGPMRRIVCTSQNSGGLPALFGAWFYGVKNTDHHHVPEQNTQSRIISTQKLVRLWRNFEDKIHAKNPGIPGASTTHGLFKNSDGKDCDKIASAVGMKLFKTTS